jgi:hypothetical protein
MTDLFIGICAREKAHLRRSIEMVFIAAKLGMRSTLHVEMIIFRNTIRWSRLLRYWLRLCTVKSTS